MKKIGRREFLGAAVATAGLSSAGALFKDWPRTTIAGTPAPDDANAGLRVIRSLTPTSQVPLGKSGIKVSMVGIGTGSIGWARHSNQTQLGQGGFTQLMRHAFDRGINFFDLADAYGSHPYFVEAMKGVPRDRYVIQTKTDSRDAQGAREDIDRFLRELHTDYIDSLIIHHVTIPDWTERYRGVMDVFAEAKRQDSRTRSDVPRFRRVASRGRQRLGADQSGTLESRPLSYGQRGRNCSRSVQTDARQRPGNDRHESRRPG